MTLFPAKSETIAGVADAIHSGRRTCVDALQTCLSRIEEWEPRVRAWVMIDRDGAIGQARSLDAEIAAGKYRGPLHGMAIGIKDIIDVEGMPTAAGSRLLANNIARADATVVTRLRQAGAVIVGKTVTTHFAFFDPPSTRNPWNTDRTPGGSSSGSAAAVACGMCFGAIGSQTGGSITRPASYCGVAGCKPTYGLVSLHGIIPLAPCMDHPGPIARTVGDLAILLDAIAGPDPRDPVCRTEPPPSIYQHLQSASSKPPRLGRLGGVFRDRPEAPMRKAFEQALQNLTAAGASVSEPSLPDSFADVIRCHRVLIAVEASAYHERRFAQHPDDYLPRIKELLLEGLATSATEYARCRQHQLRLRHETLESFRDVAVFVVPATTGPAPDAATTGDPIFNSPWSYLGLPAVSFPIALSADGLPLAIQLVGKAFDEPRLFQIAAWCEGVIGRRGSAT